MATRTISTKIAFEGEKEFKNAISEINSGLGVLNSEMKKVTAEYQDNANSVEALSAKNDVLQRKLTTQKEKVEELRKALQASAEHYGEADTRTMKWQQSLNEAEAAVYNTESAIRQNNEAMKAAQQSGEGLGNIVSSLASKFGISLPDSIKTSLNEMVGFSTGAVTAIAGVTAGVTALVKVYQELISIAKESASYVDDLNTLSVQSGIDTYTLQVLNYMEKLADVDVSSVTGSMTKLIRSMSNARDGSEDTAAAFEQLGIAITDSNGNLLDSNEVFWQAIDALGQIENETERDAISMELFGRSARDLNTLIAIGSEGFNEFAKEAENVGYIIDDQANKALNDYNDSLDRAEKALDAVKNEMAAEVAPGLQTLTEGFSDLVTEGLQLLIDSGIIEFLGDVAAVVGIVIDSFASMLEALNSLLHPIETIQELLGISNTTVEENAAMYKAATEANEDYTDQVNASQKAIESETTAVKNATDALREYAEAKGYIDITDTRLSELGSYSSSNSERGSGFLGVYSDFTKDEFKTLLEQNGITSASQISSVLGEDAYRYYLASAGYNAAGDSNWRGGLTWVGENGPELVSLPSGSGINSAQESAGLGGNTYNITIDAKSVKEFNDIVRIAQQSRITARMRG